jgi:hypothetical protein
VVSWNEADLESRLCRVLDIARGTLSYFAVDGYTDAQNPLFGFGPEKPIAETAMLLYAASAANHLPNVATRIDELARTVAPHARSAYVITNIALHPALALKFAVPHILLRKLGYDDSSFDHYLRSCLCSKVVNGHDRPPSASVERRWISSLWARQNGGGFRTDLFDSVLKYPLDILGGLRDDAYAFTHLILYCTDFGFHPRRLPRRRSAILGEAAALLLKYVDAEDYDLAGEILMAWPLTASDWSPSATFIFRVLASVEDRAGILPCGNVNLSRLTRLEGEERTRYAMGMAYHTAYVMGFLCSASLRPGRLPPLTIEGPQFDKSCLLRLLNYIQEDQGHWQQEFSKLKEEEKRVLIPLLLDMAIIQKYRRHDYNAIAEILSLACEYRIAGSPMCYQAAEVLERFAIGSPILNREMSHQRLRPDVRRGGDK